MKKFYDEVFSPADADTASRTRIVNFITRQLLVRSLKYKSGNVFDEIRLSSYNNRSAHINCLSCWLQSDGILDMNKKALSYIDG